MVFEVVVLFLDEDGIRVLYNDCRINCCVIVFKGGKLIEV